MSAALSEAEADQPLPALFATASALFADLPALCDKKNATELQRLLALLQRCNQQVESLGLFSSNETIEDVATGDLKYLLVPHYHAETLYTSPSSGGASRSEQVAQAVQLFNAFLHRCDQYDLLASDATTPSPKTVFYEEEKGQLTPELKRQYKIQKFKRERQLAGLVAALEQRPTSSASYGGAAAGSGKDAAAADGDEADGTAAGGPGMYSEEDERRLWLMRVEGAVLTSLDHRQMLKEELQLLAHAQPSRQASGQGASSSSAGGAGAGAGESPQSLMAQLRGIAGALDSSSVGAQRQRLAQEASAGGGQGGRTGGVLPVCSV